MSALRSLIKCKFSNKPRSHPSHGRHLLSIHSMPAFSFGQIHKRTLLNLFPLYRIENLPTRRRHKTVLNRFDKIEVTTAVLSDDKLFDAISARDVTANYEIIAPLRLLFLPFVGCL